MRRQCEEPYWAATPDKPACCIRAAASWSQWPKWTVTPTRGCSNVYALPRAYERPLVGSTYMFAEHTWMISVLLVSNGSSLCFRRHRLSHDHHMPRAGKGAEFKGSDSD
jgi:hypothetical protein